MSHLAAFKRAIFALFTASWSPSITRCWFYVHVLLELFHLLCPQRSCWWLCLPGNSLEQGSDLRSVTENTWLNQCLLILPPSSGSVLQINQHTESTAVVFALPGKGNSMLFQNLLINNFIPPLSSDELLYRLIVFVCPDARPLLLSCEEEHVWCHWTLDSCWMNEMTQEQSQSLSIASRKGISLSRWCFLNQSWGQTCVKLWGWWRALPRFMLNSQEQKSDL